MTRRRRAAALLGLALLLGALAASDVAGREAALRRQLGPAVPVVVVREPLRAGERIERASLAVREVPERYAPPGVVRDPTPRSDSAPRWRSPSAPTSPRRCWPSRGPTPNRIGPVLRRGERALDLVAVGAADAVVPGARVDVLVTYDGRAAASGPTRMALADVEVLAARPPPQAPTPPTPRAGCRACWPRCG